MVNLMKECTAHFIRIPRVSIYDESIGEDLINIETIRYMQSGIGWTSICVGDRQFVTTNLSFDAVCQLISNAGGNIHIAE